MAPPQMASWNLALRFGLEIAALAALGVAGWKLGTGVLRWVFAAGLPVVAAVVWATFNVPGDPSRSGRAPVEVNGWIRLAVELAIFGAATAALWYVGQPILALVVAASIVVQYATSMERIRWLLDAGA